MEDKISVLIPAYNEADRIKNTIMAIQNSPYLTRIIVLDDGSVDHTCSVASELGVEVYRFDRNHGKGYALNFGVNKAIMDSSIIVFLDADLGSSASEVDKLIYPLVNGHADVTIAKFPSPRKKGGFGLVKNLSKKGVKYLTGKEISTSLSGQRAFKVEVLKNLGKIPTDYGIEVAMTVDILNAGYSIKEVDVNMTHRETGRNLQGFIHRGRQFYQISKALIHKYKEVKNK